MRFSVEETKTYNMCTCKLTSNPPFCDGSHK
ncbi:CDGSH iron-sulfur domain-containing protein [Cellulophaga lytica]|nr:CDGSH iron-sulfur domain-containing protein [Cellulophaga omnivescoria]WBU91050.1 CDGSH iron-sulfur domain-containing protein [Cellulophaga omnivescoria]WKB83143.1 CDGSH iron-sulfur domain-containing protein [Cellulophaga lytica]